MEEGPCPQVVDMDRAALCPGLQVPRDDEPEQWRRGDEVWKRGEGRMYGQHGILSPAPRPI